MRVGIIQSNYIPWRGYFDFIAQVDMFIFYDDLQYTKRDWRNRNKIKEKDGIAWLTVPVSFTQSAPRKICETSIDFTQNWQKKHQSRLYHAYAKSAHFNRYFPDYCSIIEMRHNSISELNTQLIHWLMKCLGITTPTRVSSELNVTGSKTERLINILTTLGATHYLSGPAAADYLDLELFRRAGIQLEYKSYDYQPYPQLHGAFDGNVSVLDLLFNMGGQAGEYLHSCRENTIVVPSGKNMTGL